MSNSDAVIEKMARVLEPYLDSMLAPSARRQAPLDALAALEAGDIIGDRLRLEPGGWVRGNWMRDVDARKALDPDSRWELYIPLERDPD